MKTKAIKCYHIEAGRQSTMGFILNDSESLVMCLECYTMLVGALLSELIEEAIKDVIRERLNG